jgi:uncharacterized membrane protein
VVLQWCGWGLSVEDDPVTAQFNSSGTPTAGHGVSARTEVVISALIGLAAGALAMVRASVLIGVLIGWDFGALVYMIWLWVTIRHRNAHATAERAMTTDPDRAVTDLLLLSAAVASLVAVGFILVRAAQLQGSGQLFRVGLALVSVVVSWALVHIIFTLRYAHLYYDGEVGGIDFNQSDRPSYVDFAYLAFTIGMTFQVSDTSLRSSAIRRTALRHALLSYLFGTGILATTVNLVASLSTK